MSGKCALATTVFEKFRHVYIYSRPWDCAPSDAFSIFTLVSAREIDVGKPVVVKLYLTFFSALALSFASFVVTCLLLCGIRSNDSKLMAPYIHFVFATNILATVICLLGLGAFLPKFARRVMPWLLVKIMEGNTRFLFLLLPLGFWLGIRWYFLYVIFSYSCITKERELANEEHELEDVAVQGTRRST